MDWCNVRRREGTTASIPPGYGSRNSLVVALSGEFSLRMRSECR